MENKILREVFTRVSWLVILFIFLEYFRRIINSNTTNADTPIININYIDHEKKVVIGYVYYNSLLLPINTTILAKKPYLSLQNTPNFVVKQYFEQDNSKFTIAIIKNNIVIETKTIIFYNNGTLVKNAE